MAHAVANEIDAKGSSTTNQHGPHRYDEEIGRVGQASDDAARRHLARPQFHRARDGAADAKRPPIFALESIRTEN
jgi:hypothetical protein